MASGRTHETINLVALGAIAAGYAFGVSRGLGPDIDLLAPPPTRFAFLLSFLIGTFLVTPDLDLAENRVRAKNNWGLLGLLWVPYGSLFRHRGLSHSWFVGPLTRLAYMLLLLLALSGLLSLIGPAFGYRFGFEATLVGNWQDMAFGALSGYYLSQWLHLIADGVWPDHGLRRARRRKRRR